MRFANAPLKLNGLQWTERVPPYWRIKAVWMLFELGRGRVISNEEIADNPGSYPVYSSQTENEGVLGSIDTYDFEGDYLTWTTDGANAGTVFPRSGRFNCTNVCGTLKRKTEDVDLHFFCYALNEATHWFVRHDINPKLMNNVMAGIRVPVPSLAEQQAIAAFLDQETVRLDELVAAKERLLRLLAEKRRALITRAVTRGLDPAAPLRDSGLPWLGSIPAHWQILRLKFACESLQTGPFGSQLHAEDYIENGVPVINPAHFVGGKIMPDSRVSVDDETAARLAIHRFEPGDIVFARRGELGRCGLVTDVEAGWLCGTGSLRARPRKDKLLPEYVILVMANTFAADLLTLESVGTTMDNLNTEILGDLAIPTPPLSEQHAIVAHLTTETAKLDALREATERTIGLLKERRAALIAAAVTGKLDVSRVA